MNAKFLSSVLSVFILLVWATFASAQNVLLFTFDDSGPNVTATVTGSFDTSGLNSIGQAAPSAPDVFGQLAFGTTTATRIDLFDGVFLPSSPLAFLPHISIFPWTNQSGSIVTPLSEYFEINVGIVEGDSSSGPSIGLAEGEAFFDADALANNVIVFQQSSLDDLGNSSFLSTTPITVLSDPDGGNTIQFVLATPEIILGDVNQDGVVNFADIDPFINVLISGGFQEEADANQDGVVNFSDIPAFIAALIANPLFEGLVID